MSVMGIWSLLAGERDDGGDPCQQEIACDDDGD